MEKKQSSIEWLVQQIWKNEPLEHEQKVIEQAKAMHKQEIEEAFTRGLITEDVYYGYDDKKEEKYYNETFGGTTGVIGVDNISWTNTNKLNNGGNNE